MYGRHTNTGDYGLVSDRAPSFLHSATLRQIFKPVPIGRIDTSVQSARQLLISRF